MKKSITILLLALLPFWVFAQKEYVYKIDLVNVKKDQVSVVLLTPKVVENAVTFSFPKAIPGSYSEKDFGRFISEFMAYNNAGKSLKVEKINLNQYQILNSNTLAKITYKVSDTWDEAHSNFIFQPGGTNIQAGKNFVINNHAFFGYMEGYKMLPIKLQVTKPANFYASTNLKVARSATEDILFAKDYIYLADNPIFYSKPDTTSFTAGKTKINVSVISATNRITSAQISEWLKPMAAALSTFFNGLPVDTYQFLYYFDDPSISLARKTGGGGYGALEHNYSSLYYLPEIPIESQLKSLVDEVSSHEFLHILTPLNLHSKEIQDFDFINPKMSKHLWLYEGVTEYFAHLVQLQAGILKEADFIKNMRDKISQSTKLWNFSMTDMSSNVLTEAYKAKYESVYNKGALIGLTLDIFIREKTNHQLTLKDVVLNLSAKYGPDKPFNDDAFFDEFIAASHPAVDTFINEYIAGATPIPLQYYFNKIGYEYAPEKLVDGYFISNQIGLKYNDKKSIFTFSGVGENALGIKSGDIFYKVDGIQVTDKNLEELWDKYFRLNTSMPTLSVTVIRDDKETELSGKLFPGYKKVQDYLAPIDSASAEQKLMLDKISGRN